ncbi:MAG: PA2779 family protein [Verrucomicrobiae bacterium]|nr:PA2779 family protein [Verrucomicrobiae bacterium]
MKRIYPCAALAAAMILGVTTTVAAPVESVETGRTAALAKIEGLLAEKIVAERLTALGLSRAEVSARLAKLSDAQLQRLAAQVDQIRAGGNIESDWSDGGFIGAFFRQLGDFIYNIFKILFFWADAR